MDQGYAAFYNDDYGNRLKCRILGFLGEGIHPYAVVTFDGISLHLEKLENLELVKE